MTPCTTLVRSPINVRGGKNFETRYQAEMAARAKHAEQYCSACDDTIVRLGTMGPARGKYSVAGVNKGEAPAFASYCRDNGYSTGTSYSARFVGRTDIAWTLI